MQYIRLSKHNIVTFLQQILLLEQTYFSAEALSRQQLQAIVEQEQQIFYLLVKDTIVCGYLYATVIRSDATCDLIKLLIVEQWCKQGFGSLLLMQLINELQTQQIKRIILEVRTSNSGAKKFYQQLGFELLGIRKQFYVQPNENAEILQFMIKNSVY